MECIITTTLSTEISYHVIKTIVIDGEPRDFLVAETESKHDAIHIAKYYRDLGQHSISLVEVETRTVSTAKEVWHNRQQAS